MSDPDDATAVFSIRSSVKDLATIAYAFDLLGVRYSSRSNLVAIIISQFKDLIVGSMQDLKGQSIEFDSLQKAEEYLNLNPRVNIKDIRLGGRGTIQSMKKKMDAQTMSFTEDTRKRAEELRAILHKEDEEKPEALDEKGIPEHLQKKGGKK